MISAGIWAGLGAGVVAAAGVAQAVLGALAVRRFTALPRPAPGARPSVTVLKPLHGNEPMLEAALESFFLQDYPDYQIVFGVQSPTDPAIAVVRTLRHRFPARDVTLVIDSARHGMNQKISNVMNMLAVARHDVLVLSDSDVHAAPDYLDRVVATLAQPGTGVVTTLYTGVAAGGAVAQTLGASHITHTFLPGALLARALGRQDCLGATMAVRRETLRELGGFAALADHLADDAMLGRLARLHGLAVRLAPTVPGTTVPETTLSTLVSHEMRWARTIRSLAPAGHVMSLIQFPLAWAMLAVLLSGGARWALGLMAVAWVGRYAACRAVDAALGGRRHMAFALLPLRDWLSAAEVLASLRGRQVRWRGEILPVGRPLDDLRRHAETAYRASQPALGEG